MEAPVGFAELLGSPTNNPRLEVPSPSQNSTVTKTKIQKARKLEQPGRKCGPGSVWRGPAYGRAASDRPDRQETPFSKRLFAD
jgi:hypothetical protein